MNNLTIRILFIFTFLFAFCYSKDDKIKTEAPIEIAAVGRVSQLGKFYDARLDQFLHLSLFSKQLKKSLITSTSHRETMLKYTLEDCLEDKFRIIDVPGEQKLSILCGLFEPQGSGRYFKDTKKSAKSAKISFIQSFSNVHEKISITHENIKTLVNMDLLEEIDYATHVVVGIQWGGTFILSVEDTNSEDQDKQETKKNFDVKIKNIFELVGESGKINISESDKVEIDKFNFKIYGDISPNSMITNLIQAIEFMKKASSFVKKTNNGKEKEIKYSLISISQLRKLWKINTLANINFRRIKEETIHKCVNLFDNMNLIEQRLNDLAEDVRRFEPYIKTSKVKPVKSLQLNYSLYQTKLRENLSKHLLLVRSENETVDKLEEVILESTKDSLSWENIDIKIDEFNNLQGEISFIKMMIKLNVTLLSKSKIFQHFLWDNFNNDIYILFYDYNQSDNINKYMNQFRVMLEKKQEYGPAALFVSANLEIFKKDKTISNETKISLYRKGECYLDKYELGSKIDNYSNQQV